MTPQALNEIQQKMVDECSDEIPDQPGAAHYQRHRRNGTTACGESLYAFYWSEWTRKNPGCDPDVYHQTPGV